MAEAAARRSARIARFVILVILRAAWLSLMILTPLFGFWLASSLAAYNNGAQWVNLLLGLALFPLVPVAWELISLWRRRRREQPGKQFLTGLDRLVLRTLIVNGVFLVVMLYFSRATAFRALGQRGDWMLDGHDGAVATTVRDFLLGIADRLDGHKLAEGDGYGDSDTAPDPSTVRERDTPPAPIKPGQVTPPKTAIGWPLDDAPDPLVVGMPELAKTNIATAGAYFQEKFPDKKLRVKAIHDFVALRLVYDDKALQAIQRGDFASAPPQTAEAVFAARTGVCEGYARLMTALGAAANVEIKYITGFIRDARRRVALGSDASIKAALQGYLHAWNAVLLDGEWFLIDTTWDDPSGSDQPVRSTYLFTPPRLFAFDHLPEDPAWQLVLRPISEGDFARQPMMAPEIGRYGLTLVAPTRSQVSVSGRVEIVLDNPYGAALVGAAQPEKGGSEVRCEDRSAAGKTTVTCDLPDGEFEVRLFAAPAGTRAGSYGYIGSILVNSR